MKNTNIILTVVAFILTVIAIQLFVLISRLPATVGDVRAANSKGYAGELEARKILNRVLAVEIVEKE